MSIAIGLAGVSRSARRSDAAAALSGVERREVDRRVRRDLTVPAGDGGHGHLARAGECVDRPLDDVRLDCEERRSGLDQLRPGTEEVPVARELAENVEHARLRALERVRRDPELTGDPVSRLEADAEDVCRKRHPRANSSAPPATGAAGPPPPGGCR